MLLGLWKVVRTRRAVVRSLDPLIRETIERRGPVAGRAWQDPYMVGFLSMLIALETRTRGGGAVEGDALGLVQLDAWGRLTGRSDPAIGDRILTLSANRDAAFLEGCRNATEFHREWQEAPRPGGLPYDDAWRLEGLGTASVWAADGAGAAAGRGGGAVAELWSRHFEHHLYL